MNINRAKEIMNSAETFKVVYNGQDISIQNVDDQNETARIFFNENPEQELEVPITSLSEQ